MFYHVAFCVGTDNVPTLPECHTLQVIVLRSIRIYETRPMRFVTHRILPTFVYCLSPMAKTQSSDSPDE